MVVEEGHHRDVPQEAVERLAPVEVELVVALQTAFPAVQSFLVGVVAVDDVKGQLIPVLLPKCIEDGRIGIDPVGVFWRPLALAGPDGKAEIESTIGIVGMGEAGFVRERAERGPWLINAGPNIHNLTA